MTQKKAVRTWLILTTVFFCIAGLLSLVPVMMSPMIFDAPGSERNPAAIVLFVCIISFPVICIVSIPLSWVCYKRERFRAARLVSLAPLVNFAVGAFAAFVASSLQ